MNHTVVLDTNALIRLFKGESEEVKRAVMGAARIVIPLAVCAEFKAGVEGDSSGRSREVALFRDFLSVPNTFVHRPTELTAEYYAKIFCYLKKAGTPIPTNDIWIAAETTEIGGRLCSCDRHFANVPMLNWTFCDNF